MCWGAAVIMRRVSARWGNDGGSAGYGGFTLTLLLLFSGTCYLPAEHGDMMLGCSSMPKHLSHFDFRT